MFGTEDNMTNDNTPKLVHSCKSQLIAINEPRFDIEIYNAEGEKDWPSRWQMPTAQAMSGKIGSPAIRRS